MSLPLTLAMLDASAARRCWGRAALALLGSVALILVARRLAGAFYQPLPPGLLIACGVAIVALSTTFRLSVRGSCECLASRVLPGLLSATCAASLTLPGSRGWGLIALWGSIAAAEIVYWTRWRQPVASPTVVNIAPLETIHSTNETELDVRQRLVRGVDAAGADVLEGEVQALFVAGQRVEHVHIAFCPPFAQVPEFDCEQNADLDGLAPDAQIEVAQLFAHGARLEVKLVEPGPARVSIAIIARLGS